MRNFREKLDAFYAKYPIGLWGLIGVGGFVFLGLLICQIGATDGRGCTFEWINHAISELGFVGVSWGWWLFSLCLIIGGILGIVYILGLGLYFEGKHAGRLAKLATIGGIISCIGMIGVGLFPGNINPFGHRISAAMFFLFAMSTPFIFSIAIFVQDSGEGRQKIPRWTGIFGFFVVFTVVMFLSTGVAELERILSFGNNPSTTCRTGIIWVWFWEWMVYFVVSGWLILFAVLTCKKNTKKILNN